MENITILPPDINVSGANFTVADKTIRFGLGAVRKVGPNAVKSIVESREANGPYADIYDFCQRVDLRCVNKGVIESLIKAGALNSLKAKRSQLFQVLDQALENAQSVQRDQLVGQFSLFGDGAIGSELRTTIQPLPDIPEWPQHLILSNEKECLGFYITGHPLEAYLSEIRLFATESSGSVRQVADGAKFYLAGIIISQKSYVTKNKERMAFLTVEDMEGVVDITVLPDVFEQSASLLEIDMPILIKVQANLMNGSQKLKALEIIPLHKIRHDYTHRMILTIPLKWLAKKSLKKLHDLVTQSPGNCRLTLRIFSGKALDPIQHLDIAVHESFAVSPTKEFIAELQNLFGEKALAFELHKSNLNHSS